MSAEWYLANLPKKKTDKKEGESQDGEGEPSSGGGQGEPGDEQQQGQHQTLEDMLDEIDTLDDHSGLGQLFR